jgi:DNA-binding IclR family transcriptional regulator
MTTYKKIAAVSTTTRILNYLADQREPISGKYIAEAVGIPQGTTMCHLATLEDVNFVQRVGEHYEIGQGLAMIWARKKAAFQASIARLQHNLKELGD